MKNKILSYLLGGILILSTGFMTCTVNAQNTDDPCTGTGCTSTTGGTGNVCKDGCCGVKLNTNFPVIGNCIPYNQDGANPTNVFPYIMGILTKFIMSIILVVCFIMIIVAGVMRAAAGEDSSKTKTAKGIIEKVAITILLLGFSGVILRLINPNFFG